MKPSAVADRPLAFFEETEPHARGGTASGLTVLLAASQCPLACTMCDLHRTALPHPTPLGSIVRQIEYATESTTHRDWIKLYNGGNFFDPASIPTQDYGKIADRVGGFKKVIVENHPSLGRSRHETFFQLVRKSNSDVHLQVAIGMESVKPRLLQQVQKGTTRDRIEKYVHWLHRRSVSIRFFLMFGAPGLSRSESLRWLRLSIRHAAQLGVEHVSIVPARFGNGWNGQGHRLPSIDGRDAVEALSLSLRDIRERSPRPNKDPTLVTMDTWDFQNDCEQIRVLERMNLQQCEP